MIEDRIKMLMTTLQKLLSRGARHNIQRILIKTHAADIAEILQKMNPEERLEIFMMEPSLEKRSEVLSRFGEEHQKELLSVLGNEEALKLVSLMDKDDVADLLGHLPEEEAGEILSQMEKDDSQEVAGLMGYPEDSAGGLMSSDYLALNQDLTVAQVISRIQTDGEDGKVTFYCYVVNDNDQLVGVSSLKTLLLSKPTDKLKEIMFTDVISVDVSTHQEDVSRIVERYDFLSLPVVDSNNRLVGVITVDDVIDVIREEAEEDLLAMGRAGWGVNVSTYEHFRARMPWLIFAFLGGAVCFAIIYFFGYFSDPPKEVDYLWLLAAFIPVIMSMGAITGSQSATVAVGALRSTGFDSASFKKQWLKELKLSLLFAFLFSALVVGLGEALFPEYSLSGIMAGALLFQIILAMEIGATVPILMHRFGFDPTVTSVPLFTAIVDLTAVILLFGFYYVH